MIKFNTHVMTIMWVTINKFRVIHNILFRVFVLYFCCVVISIAGMVHLSNASAVFYRYANLVVSLISRWVEPTNNYVMWKVLLAYYNALHNTYYLLCFRQRFSWSGCRTCHRLCRCNHHYRRRCRRRTKTSSFPLIKVSYIVAFISLVSN